MHWDKIENLLLGNVSPRSDGVNTGVHPRNNNEGYLPRPQDNYCTDHGRTKEVLRMAQDGWIVPMGRRT